MTRSSPRARACFASYSAILLMMSYVAFEIEIKARINESVVLHLCGGFICKLDII